MLSLPGDRSPFAPEIEAATAASCGAERVVVWVERDQQLPAAVMLVERLLAAGCRPEVAGPFAAAHRRTLGSRPPLSSARPADEPVVERSLVGLPGEARRPPLAWRAAPGDPVPDGEWAGHVSLRELASGALDACEDMTTPAGPFSLR